MTPLILPGARANKQQGAALVLSLLVIACLSGLGLGLIAASSADLQIAANTRGAAASALAADSGVEAAISELSIVADWSTWLAGATSAFHDTTHQPRVASRAVIDLDQITLDLQAETATLLALGANTPQWRLCAWGPFSTLAGVAASATGAYVAVWVADDPADADGNAASDANGIVQLHGEAFGYGATRRSVDVVIQRAAVGARVLSWRPR